MNFFINMLEQAVRTIGGKSRSGGLILVVFLFSFTIAYGGGKSDQDKKPSAVTDLITVVENGETFVFFINEKTEGLFRYKLTAENSISSTGVNGKIELSQFERVKIDKKMDEKMDEPYALAYYQKKIYICEKDESSAAVYEVDVFSSAEEKPVNKVISRPQISQPWSIAISEKGVMAIGDKKDNRIFLFKPEIDSLTGKLRYEPFKQLDRYDRPRRLHFVGEDLVVFDSKERRLSVINNSSLEAENPKIKELNYLIAKIEGDLKTIDDFSVYNGVFYITDSADIFAFTPASSYEKYPVIKNSAKIAANSSGIRLTCSRNFIFIWNPDGGGVVKVMRPTPVSINFELPSEIDRGKLSLESILIGQRRALIDFYIYLHKKDILPTKTAVAEQDYENIEKFLIKEKVLIDRPLPLSDEIRETDYLRKLTGLLCILNPELCNGESLKNQGVFKEQAIKLPDIPIEVGLTLSDINLNGKPIDVHLQERLIESQRKLITPKYLIEINKRHLQNYETTIINDNFIPVASPNPDLKPGTFISFDGNREKVIRSWESCLQRVQSELERSSFPPLYNLTSNTVEGILPQKDSQNSERSPNTQLDVKKVTVDFKDLQSESIKPATLTAIQEELGASECRIPESSREIYLIDKAIAATGARYKLFKGNETLRSLKDSEVISANLLGAPSKNLNYSLDVDDRFYIAYTLRRVDVNKPVGEWELIRDYNQVKTWDIAAMLNENNKTLILPATRWRMSVYVDPIDFNNQSSPLYEPHKKMPGIKILSEENLNIITTRFGDEPVFERDDGQGNCQNLLSATSDRILSLGGLRPSLNPLREFKIGVAEESVYKSHFRFANAWLKEDPDNDTNLIPDINLVSDTEQPCHITDYVNSDHGTHVTGLLKTVFPKAKLFLIPTSQNESPAGLEVKLDNAVTRNIRLFNFSFKIEDKNIGSLPKIKDKMYKNSAWNQSLFITAAGNDGENLSALTWAPIGWANELPNIIGVAALDDEKNLLNGSNYGKAFVQIAAPGKAIISTSASNNFSMTDGTSQAVPQVAATAAILSSLGNWGPLQIKARLIYTTDWLSQHSLEHVWGGKLNVYNAVTYPTKNLLRRKSDGDKEIYSLEFNLESSNLKITNKASGDCKMDDPFRTDMRPCPNGEILFKDVLRIQLMPDSNNLYRVIYLEDNGKNKQMISLKNVALDAKVACIEALHLNHETGSFENDNLCRELKESGQIDTTVIYDYIGSMPTTANIRF